MRAGRPRSRRASASGLVEGASILAALAFVPAALVAAVHAPLVAPLGLAVDVLVATAATTWAVLVLGLATQVVAHLRRDRVPTGPLGWAAVRVAALVLLVAPFLEPSHGHVRGGTARASVRASAAAVATVGAEPLRPTASILRDAGRGEGARRCRHGAGDAPPLGSGVLLVPLAADVRRRVRLRRRGTLRDEAAIDVETALLAHHASAWPPLSAVAAALAAAGRLRGAEHVVLRDGLARLDDESWRFDPVAPRRDVRALVVPLGVEGGSAHVLLVPRGAVLGLAGPSAADLLADAARVGAATGLGRPSLTDAQGLLRALARRDDDELVVCVGDAAGLDGDLRSRCVVVDRRAPVAVVDVDAVELADGRVLDREVLADSVRSLLDGTRDEPLTVRAAPTLATHADARVVVRLLTAVPRVDGLAAPLEPGRERRAVELLAYLSLRAGEPVTGERLRVRVLGTGSTDAAAKTLFNVASSARRALGEGAFGPRLPAAGRVGRYAVAPDVVADVTLLEAHVEEARRCADGRERLAWLRGALELVESEPFATVLEGYDWFLTEGHLARLQTTCEDAACELVDLALGLGHVELAAFALDRARLVDPHAERLTSAAVRVAAARGASDGAQASLDAMAPAARSTLPSAPAAR